MSQHVFKRQTHREMYPEQYRHSLVGKWVVHEGDHKNDVGLPWQVRTVVQTAFGLLATPHGGGTAYLVDDLVVVAAQDWEGPLS